MIIKTAQPLTGAFIVKAIRNKLDANHRLQRLQDYYNGKHDILLRQYDDPIKPNNKIVVNYCKSIADFMTAYLVGVPVTYEAPPIIVDSLNYNDNDDTTMQTALNMNIHGFGCELFYTDSDGLPRFESIDPRECIFILDDTLEALLTGFIRVYPDPDDIDGYNVTVYTSIDYTDYKLSLSIGELQPVGEAIPHYFQDVPVVLYRNNNEFSGTFEGVISLQDALNKLVSDEINDFESFVDAYLVLEGMQATTPEDIAKMKRDRVLLLDPDSKAYWLIKDVNNAHIRELKTSLATQIRELANLPDLENLGSFGASGVALQFKLIRTEIQAAKQERIIKRGIQRKLELLYNIFNMTSNIGKYTDVDITFERNFIMLTEDAIRQGELDRELVQDEIMSKERYLMEHKGMTLNEARDELQTVAVEQFRIADSTFPLDEGVTP